MFEKVKASFYSGCEIVGLMVLFILVSSFFTDFFIEPIVDNFSYYRGYLLIFITVYVFATILHKNKK